MTELKGIGANAAESKQQAYRRPPMRFQHGAFDAQFPQSLILRQRPYVVDGVPYLLIREALA